mgnify:CR=1 FL=1|jgi:hypothetical protein
MFAFAKLCNDNIEGKNKFKSNGKDNFNIQHSLLIIQYSKTKEILNSITNYTSIQI